MQEKQEQQIEIVAPSTDKVMCDGGTGDLGHPAVYFKIDKNKEVVCCLLYTSPSPRDLSTSRMPSSA